MHRKPTIATAIMFALSVSACATGPGPYDLVQELEVTRSTQEDAIVLMGQPASLIEHAGGTEALIWQGWGRNGLETVTVEFWPDGKMKGVLNTSRIRR